MSKQERTICLIALAVAVAIWILSRIIGNGFVETLCEILAVGAGALVCAMILGALLTKPDGKMIGESEAIGLFLIFFAVLAIPHFIVSGKLAAAKWEMRVAINHDYDKTGIQEALAHRDAILYRSSTFMIGDGWKYDRHTHYFNRGWNLYLWVPFSKSWRKPATTNGLGSSP